MEIEVRIDDEVVFSGLAEDFLYEHDDIELEYALDSLECKPIGSVIEFDDMEIEKLLRLIWDWMTILLGNGGNKKMSMHSRLSKLDIKIKNKIIALLYANGCESDDVTMLLNVGTLADIDGIIDLCEVFEWALTFYVASRTMCWLKTS